MRLNHLWMCDSVGGGAECTAGQSAGQRHWWQMNTHNAV